MRPARSSGNPLPASTYPCHSLVKVLTQPHTVIPVHPHCILKISDRALADVHGDPFHPGNVNGPRVWPFRLLL